MAVLFKVIHSKVPHPSLAKLSNQIFITHMITKNSSQSTYDEMYLYDNSSVPEGKLMEEELIGVYKSGSINWGY